MGPGPYMNKNTGHAYLSSKNDQCGCCEYFSVVNKAGLIIKAFQISRIRVCIIIRYTYMYVLYSTIRHGKVVIGSVHYC